MEHFSKLDPSPKAAKYGPATPDLRFFLTQAAKKTGIDEEAEPEIIEEAETPGPTRMVKGKLEAFKGNCKLPGQQNSTAINTAAPKARLTPWRKFP